MDASSYSIVNMLAGVDALNNKKNPIELLLYGQYIVGIVPTYIKLSDLSSRMNSFI